MKPIHLVCAVIGGAIAGAAVGLLFAPDKGEDTRKRVGKFVKETSEKIPTDKLKALLGRTVEKAEEEL